MFPGCRRRPLPGLRDQQHQPKAAGTRRSQASRRTGSLAAARRPEVLPSPYSVSRWVCGKEVLDRGDQEVGLVFRDEGATVGDQLESALRQQSCQPSSMVAGKMVTRRLARRCHRHSQDSAVGYIESRVPATPTAATRETRVSATPKRRKCPTVPTRLHHHQVGLMAERVEERKRDARADQRE